MNIPTVGIDLAKNVLAMHGVNASGAVQRCQPKVARTNLNALVASLPPCTIGIEACSGAHHCARQFRAHGHSVRLMAPKLVTPYRMSGKRGKNDPAHAATICEVVRRPDMTQCKEFREQEMPWRLDPTPFSSVRSLPEAVRYLSPYHQPIEPPDLFAL